LRFLSCTYHMARGTDQGIYLWTWVGGARSRIKKRISAKMRKLRMEDRNETV
jgi:hypothetical protein